MGATSSSLPETLSMEAIRLVATLCLVVMSASLQVMPGPLCQVQLEPLVALSRSSPVILTVPTHCCTLEGKSSLQLAMPPRPLAARFAFCPEAATKRRAETFTCPLKALETLV